jgi:hypothetical protein
VKKFKDRATAVSRIWKAIQSLGQAAPATEEPTPVPEAAPVPEQQASETAQPETVMEESTEFAVSIDVPLHAPDVTPQGPAAILSPAGVRQP